MQPDDRVTAELVRTPIVEFMVIRAPEPVNALESYRHFIRDEISRAPVGTHVPASAAAA